MAKDRYHHGDLRNALVEAAIDLARAGGPRAVVLREAARRVGVSATSAYRHFESHQELLAVVKTHAQAALTEAMRGEPVPVDADDPDVARLHALGRGYLRFARVEPGWFRAAFDEDSPTPISSESFRLLSEALDAVAAAGRMSAARREGAELSVWATVHGLAELMRVGGPLSALADEEADRVIGRTQDFITAALTG